METRPRASTPAPLTLGVVQAVLAAALLAAISATPATAQGFGFFGNLFGGGFPGQNRAAPAYPGYNNGYAPRPQSDTYYDRPRHRLPRRKPAEQVQREAPKERPTPPPKDASIFVYVFGDSLGQLLASGLDEALADRQDVAVIHKARGSTGLVATDYFDWPKSIADLLAGRDAAETNNERATAKAGAPGTAGDKPRVVEGPDGKDAAATAQQNAKADKTAKQKIDVAVMMIGSNDRQALQIDGKTVQPGTPGWTVAYAKRVMAIDEAFRARSIPLVWVGVPITKDDAFADAMAALNDIYREAAAKTGAIYVDTWEAFSDDNGNFSSYGPDVNGQTVRLRAADGVYFTKAGARKLAHFVETHVRRALEGKTPVAELPTAELPPDNLDGGAKEQSSAKAAVAARPDAGPIRNLTEPPSAASGTLATLDPKAAARASLAYSAILHAGAASVPAGRADDARWAGAAGASFGR